MVFWKMMDDSSSNHNFFRNLGYGALQSPSTTPRKDVPHNASGAHKSLHEAGDFIPVVLESPSSQLSLNPKHASCETLELAAPSASERNYREHAKSARQAAVHILSVSWRPLWRFKGFETSTSCSKWNGRDTSLWSPPGELGFGNILRSERWARWSSPNHAIPGGDGSTHL